jgi:hypothetical protein
MRHGKFIFYYPYESYGSSEPGDEPLLFEGYYSANTTPIRLVQCGNVFYTRFRIGMNIRIRRYWVCMPIDFRSQDDRQNLEDFGSCSSRSPLF